MDLPPYIVRDFSQALVMAGSRLSNGVDPDQRGKWRGRDQVGGEMVVFQIFQLFVLFGAIFLQETWYAPISCEVSDLLAFQLSVTLSCIF